MTDVVPSARYGDRHPYAKMTAMQVAELRKRNEAGASSQWHGVSAYIRTFDGRTIEVRESAGAIAKMLRAADGGSK